MYLEQLKTSVLSLIVLTVLTGLVYPVVMTEISQTLFPAQAKGSLIMREGKAVGSELIGQPFDDPKYFWGRLSATTPAYNGASSSGSNLGPLNPALIKAAQERIDALHKADPGNKNPVPVDLVTSSASGLDPQITPAAARYQLVRVARVRHLPELTVEKLIHSSIEGRWLGVLGEPRVNVLKLNLALDGAAHESKT